MKRKIKEGDVLTIFDLNKMQLVSGTVTLVKEANDLYGYITQGQYHVFSLPWEDHAGGEEFVVADEEILAVNNDFYTAREELIRTIATKVRANDTRLSMLVLSRILGVLLADQIR